MDEWLRIVEATDPGSPIYDEALSRYQAEEDHAEWSAAVHRMIAGAEALLREASEG